MTDRNEGVFCSRNKFGLDVSFRAFLDYTSRNLNYLNKKGQFQTTVNGWTQFHWAYMKDFATYTAVSYEYTELSEYIIASAPAISSNTTDVGTEANDIFHIF